MPCPQNKDLLKNNIKIDLFSNQDKRKNMCYFLTHAHKDHMKGLERWYSGKGTIYCTETTAQLVIFQTYNWKTPLKMKDFKIIKYNSRLQYLFINCREIEF